MLVNAATPRFNDRILDLAVGDGAFGEARSCGFPHQPGEVMTYPVYQKEILSLRSYLSIGAIRMFVGGSEVELIKSLFSVEPVVEARHRVREDGTVCGGSSSGALSRTSPSRGKSSGSSRTESSGTPSHDELSNAADEP